ncbi:MAG: sigma-70 family RNA polymerase sigma factor [Verrucomicrobiaceae bacterium]|nr:sigma-70 family RNA polymerase sigma factor [Verrucomicrobiaceae bacterium]
MTSPELERLYDDHASGLFLYLLSFAKTEADARDLLQELFIKLAQIESAETLRCEKSFVYRLAHNLAIDWLRKRCRRQETEEQIVQETAMHSDSGVDPDRAALAVHLMQALASLPDEQRTVMQLKLWEELTFEEIAEVQGIPLNTAASRYRYATEKLRLLLRPIYEELK